MLKDYFVYVMKHLMRRRLRSWLTLLGIFIGMTAVVSLISLSQGLQDAIMSEFETVGSDRIIVQPGGSLAGPFSSGLSIDKLTNKELSAIRQIHGVEFAGGMTSTMEMIKFRDQAAMAYIIGMPTDSKTIYNVKRIGFFSIMEGRELKSNSRYEAVVGYAVAIRFFDRNITTRDSLIIRDKTFRVVGIQSKASTGIHNLIVRIPQKVAKQIFGIGDEYSMIFVRVAKGYSPEEIAEEIKRKLRQLRNVKEGEENFTVETAREVVNSFLRILGMVQMLIIGVAAISLVVGGIGIMNTMFTAVLERTKEIGIMKAIGARNRDILSIFLIESGFLGLAGGLIGVFLGFFLSKSVEILARRMWDIDILKAHISVGLIVSVLLFAFVLGVAAGLTPARRAAMMPPAEALRA